MFFFQIAGSGFAFAITGKDFVLALSMKSGISVIAAAETAANGRVSKVFLQ
ncbi:hypothetical protein ACKJPP_09940 [Neisseria polysaccharea]|uniref:hypothetical protein n=1 Tax=Neisseria TaxID=482 RepID=UPI001900AD35|nr:hypothetical protein [Neisseria meningitidis]